MITIAIDNETCVRCGKCVKVCPSYILTQTEKKADIGLHKIDHCISCGHCVAVCPTFSVIHSDFPKTKVHTLNRDILPQPEQMMELIRARRSNRALSDQPVPQEMLQQIVEAAHLAPTATNAQQVKFVLVTNPEVLKQVADLTIDIYAETAKKLSHPLVKPFVNLIKPGAKEVIPKLKGLVKAYKAGTDTVLRGAKAALFIYTPDSVMFGKQDANLAYQNGSLMAESLGVAQFYTGFICSASDLDKKKKRICKLLNIEGTIHAGMALSMPRFKFRRYTDRKPLDLQII